MKNLTTRQRTSKLACLTAALFIATAGISGATTLDDLLNLANQMGKNQEAAPKEAPPAAAPYTLQEIFDLLPNAYFLYSLQRSDDRPYGFLLRDDEKYKKFKDSINGFDRARLDAFRRQYFGTNADPLWGSPGYTYSTYFFEAAAKYIADNSPSSEAALAQTIQTALKSYERDDMSRRYLPNAKAFLDQFMSHVPQMTNAYKVILQQDDEVYKSIADPAKEKAAKDKVAKEQLDKCLNGNPYKVYKLSVDLFNNNRSIQYNQSQIDRQNEIGKVSGLVDRSVMYTAGQNIVSSKRYASDLFAKYKSLGGKASSYQSVTPDKDPCN